MVGQMTSNHFIRVRVLKIRHTMDYTKKYNELTSGLLQCFEDISEKYPNANAFEKCVIGLRTKGWTYGQIQSKLGMPAKKQLRAVLLKWAPDLIDNSVEKVIRIHETESNLYRILSRTTQTEFEDENSWVSLWIENNEIKYEDETGDSGIYHDLDERTQKEYLLLVKKILNA